MNECASWSICLCSALLCYTACASVPIGRRRATNRLEFGLIDEISTRPTNPPTRHSEPPTRPMGPRRPEQGRDTATCPDLLGHEGEGEALAAPDWGRDHKGPRPQTGRSEGIVIPLEDDTVDRMRSAHERTYRYTLLLAEGEDEEEERRALEFRKTLEPLEFRKTTRQVRQQTGRPQLHAENAQLLPIDTRRGRRRRRRRPRMRRG